MFSFFHNSALKNVSLRTYIGWVSTIQLVLYSWFLLILLCWPPLTLREDPENFRLDGGGDCITCSPWPMHSLPWCQVTTYSLVCFWTPAVTPSWTWKFLQEHFYPISSMACCWFSSSLANFLLGSKTLQTSLLPKAQSHLSWDQLVSSYGSHMWATPQGADMILLLPLCCSCPGKLGRWSIANQRVSKAFCDMTFNCGNQPSRTTFKVPLWYGPKYTNIHI